MTQAPRAISGIGSKSLALLPHFGKRWLMLALVSLFSVAAHPLASAASPDGDYVFESASGSITANGETIDLPQDVLRNIAAIKNGKIAIKNKKIQLNRKAAAKIVNQLGEEFGITFETEITGPTSVTLHKSGRKWTGSTTEPVVVSFSATYEGEDVSGNIKTNFECVVKGGTLKVTVPLTGKALGMKLEGEILIVCRK